VPLCHPSEMDTTHMALSAEERQRLRSLLDSLGEREALARLGLNRHLVARAVGGLSIRRGSVALLRDALARQAMER
jgi:hypothetical protein